MKPPEPLYMTKTDVYRPLQTFQYLLVAVDRYL